ncbi:MAG: alpha/beta hydrolase [Nocardioides sp.]|nr:alpha/beta hydrolase [Nocardioides sp.]
MSPRSLIPVRDTELEVDVLGAGDPVVIVQTALAADELLPLADLVQREGCQVIHYHRRGYARSGAAASHPSVAEDAADCRALIAALDIAPSHVVGVSYSAAVALSLASSSPECVRTLSVLEPPPIHVLSAAQFRAANAQLSETHATQGSGAALEQFLRMLVGPDWRGECERQLPGSVAVMERDAPTFFQSDIPAMLAWTFTAEDAARIRCPVLYIGGSESGPWFAEVRDWVGQLLPQVHDTSISGAGHMLAATHPAQVAHQLINFVRNHP